MTKQVAGHETENVSNYLGDDYRTHWEEWGEYRCPRCDYSRPFRDSGVY